MPLYRYVAISEKGRKVTGAIDADYLQDAKLKLIGRQISVIHIEPIPDKKIKVSMAKKELLAWTQELNRLLIAGLALFEALSALEEKYRAGKIHTLLLDLCEQVRSGRAFSSALARHPKIFDLLYVAMIANAEKTGRLTGALEEIAILLSRQLEVKKQIISALLYPALLSTFCFVVLAVLLFFVVPSLKELFDGRNLHPLTQIVFACSEFAIHAKLFLSLAGVAFAATGIYMATTISGKERFLSLLSRFPLTKSLFAKIALVRFARASAALLEGGLPATAALASARQVMRHPVLEKVVLSAETKLVEGEPLHTAFKDHPLIPPLVPRMIAIAQQSGKLAFMMQQIAQIYEGELEVFFLRFASMAQPILLLILGGIVGFVLLSVLLPLTDVSSFVT